MGVFTKTEFILRYNHSYVKNDVHFKNFHVKIDRKNNDMVFNIIGL